jgi:hypothetical protein
MMLVMTVVGVMSAAAWFYLRPADQQTKVTAMLSDLSRLRADVKRNAEASGNLSNAYAGLSVVQLYGWGIVPIAMRDTDTTVMITPWNTRMHVATWPLVNAAGAAQDVADTAFNLRFEMPPDEATRKVMCAPLVTALASTWPQLSYTNLRGLTGSTPGTPVITVDLPATSNRIATIVTTVCSQANNFVLVVADA